MIRKEIKYMIQEIVHAIVIIYVIGIWLLFATYTKSQNDDMSKAHKWNLAFIIIAVLMAIYTVAIISYGVFRIVSSVEDKTIPKQNTGTESEIMTDVLIYNPEMEHVKEVHLCPEEVNWYIAEYGDYPEWLKYAIDDETHVVFEFSEIMDNGYFRYIKKE